MSGPVRNAADYMPADWLRGLFAGRADFGDGPSPVLIKAGRLYDMSAVAPTASRLLEHRALAMNLGRDCGPLAAAPWTFGVADLMLNLAQRGLLKSGWPCDIMAIHGEAIS